MPFYVLFCSCVHSNLVVSRNSGRPLSLQLIAKYGRMILEGLKYFEDNQFPYYHLHTGNVIILNSTAMLSDYENSFFGLKNRLSPRLKKIAKEPHAVQFGFLLYEMATATELNFDSSNNVDYRLNNSAYDEVDAVLSSIFDGRATVSSLIELPFFQGVKVRESSLSIDVDPKINKITGPVFSFVKDVVFTRAEGIPIVGDSSPNKGKLTRPDASKAEITRQTSSMVGPSTAAVMRQGSSASMQPSMVGPGTAAVTRQGSSASMQPTSTFHPAPAPAPAPAPGPGPGPGPAFGRQASAVASPPSPLMRASSSVSPGPTARQQTGLSVGPGPAAPLVGPGPGPFNRMASSAPAPPPGPFVPAPAPGPFARQGSVVPSKLPPPPGGRTLSPTSSAAGIGGYVGPDQGHTIKRSPSGRSLVPDGGGGGYVGPMPPGGGGAVIRRSASGRALLPDSAPGSRGPSPGPPLLARGGSTVAGAPMPFGATSGPLGRQNAGVVGGPGPGASAALRAISPGNMNPPASRKSISIPEGGPLTHGPTLSPSRSGSFKKLPPAPSEFLAL